MFKPKHISFSAINLYKTCPACYAAKYVTKTYVEVNILPFRFGKAVHVGLEQYYQGLDWRKATMLHLWDGFKADEYDKAEYTRLFRMAEAMLETVVKTGRTYEAAYIEQKLFVPLTNPLSHEEIDIPILGYVDLITKDDQVIDHKTSTDTLNEVSEDNSFQLDLYSMMFRRKYQRAPSRLTIQKIVKRMSVGEVIYIDQEPDEFREAQVFFDVKQVVEDIKAEKFEFKQINSFFRKHICQ